MFDLWTYHGSNAAYVNINLDTCEGYLVDFNCENPHLMRFSVASIEVQTNDNTRAIYELPITDNKLALDIGECMMFTELCQYDIYNDNVVAHSQSKSGSMLCWFYGKTLPGERALVSNDTVWVGHGVMV